MLEMDWRLVEAFDLNDVDTALLQEMVPSLAFSLVTEANCTSPRLTCKLICMLQLVVETFIECRKSDAYEMHLLREDMIATSNERDSFRMRLKEAKTDIKAFKSQLSRCTTLLRSCSHVLHAHGVSPHALAALESILATSESHVTPEPAKVAHICAFCGKAFSSQDFLVKHIERRHASTPIDEVVKTPRTELKDDTQGAVLTRLELLLAQHEVAIKRAAADEAEKIKALQNELSIERNLSRELKHSRSEVQWRLEESQRQLSTARYEKDDALRQVALLQETVKSMEQKLQTEVKGQPKVPSGPQNTQIIQRLEGALEHAKEALAVARKEMQEEHDKYTALLLVHEKSKQDGMVPARPTSCNISTQTDAVPFQNMACQAEIIQAFESSPTVDQVVALKAPELQLMDASSQTESTATKDVQTMTMELSLEISVDAACKPLVSRDYSDVVVQTDPIPVSLRPEGISIAIQASELLVKEMPPAEENVELEDAQESMKTPDAPSPEIIAAQIEDAIILAVQRADRNATSTQVSSLPSYPLKRRPYITSTWAHGDDHVNETIVQHLNHLDGDMERYGVNNKTTSLSQDQYDMVMSTYKGHLNMLPVAVLERMVALDVQVQNILETKWVPSEKHREDVLKSLRAKMDRQDTERQAWITQILKSKASAGMATPVLEKQLPEYPTAFVETGKDTSLDNLPASSAVIAQAGHDKGPRVENTSNASEKRQARDSTTVLIEPKVSGNTQAEPALPSPSIQADTATSRSTIDVADAETEEVNHETSLDAEISPEHAAEQHENPEPLLNDKEAMSAEMAEDMDMEIIDITQREEEKMDDNDEEQRHDVAPLSTLNDATSPTLKHSVGSDIDDKDDQVVENSNDRDDHPTEEVVDAAGPPELASVSDSITSVTPKLADDEKDDLQDESRSVDAENHADIAAEDDVQPANFNDDAPSTEKESSFQQSTTTSRQNFKSKFLSPTFSSAFSASMHTRTRNRYGDDGDDDDDFTERRSSVQLHSMRGTNGDDSDLDEEML
ncbi:hypothetical protein AeMF1_011935 [Aphanomyces euteiches]|nr:hypothetical protein AeMF1_011935 [Aphanomyces euteiches]KAH9187993.1 hypothetical protein AeNC1_010027 [Aphanomyces euteiches]